MTASRRVNAFLLKITCRRPRSASPQRVKSRTPAFCILNKFLDIRSIDLPAHRDRQFEFVKRTDGFADQIFAALGVKRKVARKQHVIGAEVVEAATRRGC